MKMINNKLYLDLMQVLLPDLEFLLLILLIGVNMYQPLLEFENFEIYKQLEVELLSCKYRLQLSLP